MIVEWDIAFAPEDAAVFNGHCAARPDRVHVAPYRLYPASTALPEPVWAHRDTINPDHHQWVNETAPECDYFGFGMVYLPLRLIRAYLATGPEVTGGTEFSRWHHGHVGERVPIHWDVRPVHLHY